MRKILGRLVDAAARGIRFLGEDKSFRNCGGGSYHRLGPVFFQRIAAPESGEFVRRLGLKLGNVSVYLHEMVAPDPGRDLHNHPWKAAFLVLSGGYAETRAVAVPDPGHLVYGEKLHRAVPERDFPQVTVRELSPGAINLLSQEVYHRVDRLLDGESSWTLGVVWDRKPSWGFWVPKKGYVDSAEYHKARDAGGFTPPSAPAEVSPARFDTPLQVRCVKCGLGPEDAHRHCSDGHGHSFSTVKQ